MLAYLFGVSGLAGAALIGVVVTGGSLYRALHLQGRLAIESQVVVAAALIALVWVTLELASVGAVGRLALAAAVVCLSVVALGLWLRPWAPVRALGTAQPAVPD